MNRCIFDCQYYLESRFQTYVELRPVVSHLILVLLLSLALVLVALAVAALQAIVLRSLHHHLEVHKKRSI